jgi:hypothetical protein
MPDGGLTNERRDMDYIPNAELDADDCRACGATWERCLQGWSETDQHPAGVCCPKCHSTDTHKANAARQRAQPSGDALDRATRMISAAGPISLNQTWIARLANEVAKLIDRADAAGTAERELLQNADGLIATINRLRAELKAADAELRSVRAQRDIRDRQAREFIKSAGRLSARVRELEESGASVQSATTDQLLGELRRRMAQ